MKSKFSIFLALLFVSLCASSAPRPGIFELKVYHYSTSYQRQMLDSFVQFALLPYLDQQKITSVGAFSWVGNDTAADKKLYLFIPYSSVKQWEKVSGNLQKIGNGTAYFDAPHTRPAYNRLETILLKAFEYMPGVSAPKLAGDRADHIYELRSYEGPGEKLYKRKVTMFNQGGEVGLFSRLGFNAVFYAEVIAGSRMPNLMYMTSFNNQQSRDEHWKTFSADEEWKKLSSLKEYQNTVSHADIIFLKATSYSKL